MKKANFLVLMAAVLALVAVACGSAPSEGSASGENTSVSNTDVETAGFSVDVVRNVGGDNKSSTFSLAANRGKSTVLYFSFAG
ncbi:MAG: hypothetical protein V3T49_09930 [Dehalococcoidia bacterium]